MLNLYNANNHNGNGLTNGINKDTPPRQAVNGKLKKPGFEKYIDPTGDFPTNEFKWSIWYIKNKVLLYKIAVGTLIGLNIIFWGLSLWKWGDFLIFGLTENQRLAQDSTTFSDYTVYHPLVSARPLQVVNTAVFSGSGNKVDAVAEMANPNVKFTVSFDYYFVFGTVKTPVQKGMLLAGESRPVVQLGLDGGIYSGAASLVLENVSWKRISGHKTADPVAWQKERLKFVISDFVYVSRGSALAGDSSAVQFKLKNDTAYGFSAPKFLVGLYQSQILVGVVPYEIENFVAQGIKDVDIRNFPPNLNVTEVAVFPLIDPYNKEVYLEPEK